VEHTIIIITDALQWIGVAGIVYGLALNAFEAWVSKDEHDNNESKRAEYHEWTRKQYKAGWTPERISRLTGLTVNQVQEVIDNEQ